MGQGEGGPGLTEKWTSSHCILKCSQLSHITPKAQLW